jgi:hypothetical protein
MSTVLALPAMMDHLHILCPHNYRPLWISLTGFILCHTCWRISSVRRARFHQGPFVTDLDNKVSFSTTGTEWHWSHARQTF